MTAPTTFHRYATVNGRQVFYREAGEPANPTIVLLHGFGLSTRLQQLSMGQEATIWKILAFNVGVELGQIVALIPILALINLWRQALGHVRHHRFAAKGQQALVDMAHA